MQKQMRQFLAPYADTLKQLSSKAGDFKGYPLKSAMRISFGGEHCAAAKSSPQASGSGGNVVGDASQAAAGAAAGSAAGAAGSAAGTAAANATGNSVAGSVLGSAAGAFGSKLVSGLFAKKKTEPAAATPNRAPNNAPPANMVQLAEITVETTAITPGAVPGTRFDIPAGWKLVQPKESKPEKEFTCPTARGSP